MPIGAISNAVSPCASEPGSDRLDREIDCFTSTGAMSPQAFAEAAKAAGPSMLSQGLSQLSPAQRGALESELIAQGLGGLLGGVTDSVVGGTIDTAVGVVDVAADDAVETRSERQVDDQRTTTQDQRMAEILGQSSFDAVVTPNRKTVAPPVALDWAASFGSPVGQPAPKVDRR
jgi:hypothetical protein